MINLVVFGQAISLSLIIFFLGCKDKRAEKFDEEKYLAHLTLDESTIIVTQLISGLEVPWEVTYGNDGWLWYTELKGTVNKIHPETGEQKMLLKIPDVHYVKSRGLLGMAVHPNVEYEPYVYLHYTFAFTGKDNLEVSQSRLVRYTYEGDSLIKPLVLLDSIPGKSFHNGSRLKISADGKLYFSMGDIGETSLTQNPRHLAGKILRFNLDGSIPADNPFPENAVWAWGFRNPQGLVIAPNGTIYASDHGANNDDEVNLVMKGRNYGWPQVAGFCDSDIEKKYCQDSLIVEPLIAWTPTIAVAGLEYYPEKGIPEWQNSLLLGNLKGRAFRVLHLNEKGDEVVKERIYFQKHFGRIRDVAVAPNGDIFLATSNLDWHPRFQPFMYDSFPTGGDKILKLQKATPRMLAQLENIVNPVVLTEDPEQMALYDENWEFEPVQEHLVKGQKLYLENCAACHRPDGEGVDGLIPPLAGTDWVIGDKARLIQILLKGMSEPIEVRGAKYEHEMPPFSHLPDEDLAHILTYIRQSFGNNANAVIEGEVFEERKGL